MKSFRKSPVIKSVYPIREVILIFLLGSIQFVCLLDFLLIMPMAPRVQSLFSLDTFQLGILLSLPALCSGIINLFAGFFIHKINRRYLFLLLLACMAGGELLTAFSHAYYLFLLARMVTGCAGGLILSSLLTIMGESFPKEKRGRVTAYVLSAYSIVIVAGIPLALIAAEKFIWHVPFNFLAVLACINLLIAYTYIPGGKLQGTPEKTASPLTSFLNSKYVLIYVLASVFMFAGGATVLPFLSSFLVKNLEFKAGELSIVYFLGGVFTLLTGPAIGRLSDKYGRLKIFFYASAASVLSILLVTNITAELHIYGVYLFTSLFFISTNARFIVTTSFLQDLAPAHNRAGFTSILYSVQQLTASIASVLTGFLIEEDMLGKIENFWLIGLLSVLASIICVIIKGGFLKNKSKLQLSGI